MGKIIAFSNQKGGVGKTTTCVNMSSCLAGLGKKVLILDLDPQGNATSSLGIEKNENLKSIYNVIIGETNIMEIMVKNKVARIPIAVGFSFTLYTGFLSAVFTVFCIFAITAAPPLIL